MTRALPVFVLACAFGGASAGADDGAYARLAAMGAAAEDLRDYSMTLRRQEWRLDAMGPEETVAVRWASGERYFFQILKGDGEGRRVAFRRGWNGDRLRVRLATWPHPRVNLEPCAKLALEGVHRPVVESSLVYLVRSVQANVAKGRARGENLAATLGEKTFLGRPCVRVEFSGPLKTRSVHVVQKGETLQTIGATLGVSVRTLLHANRARGYAACDAVRAGDRIEVPRYDASKVELCIDKQTSLPLEVLLWDDDGVLFEKFAHADLVVNTGLTDADFEP
jgi:hypothetical protein